MDGSSQNDTRRNADYQQKYPPHMLEGLDPFRVDVLASGWNVTELLVGRPEAIHCFLQNYLSYPLVYIIALLYKKYNTFTTSNHTNQVVPLRAACVIALDFTNVYTCIYKENFMKAIDERLVFIHRVGYEYPLHQK